MLLTNNVIKPKNPNVVLKIVPNTQKQRKTEHLRVKRRKNKIKTRE